MAPLAQEEPEPPMTRRDIEHCCLPRFWVRLAVSSVERFLIVFVLLVSVLLVSTCASPHRWDFEQDGPLVGGIEINEPDKGAWHDALESAGLNTISMTVYARHQKWDSAEFSSDADPASLVEEIRAARKRGLEVVLILRVALEHGLEENLFYWHGMIQPRTDQQVEQWFERYADYVLQFARLAEAEGVAVVGLGSELNSLASTTQVTELPPLEEYFYNLEKQARENQRAIAAAAEAGKDGADLDGQLKAGWGKTYDDLDIFLDERTTANRKWAVAVTHDANLEAFNQRRALLDREWRELIQKVRRVYGGKLTYAANFDQYDQVGFWDALDLIGINAYFPLRDSFDLPAAEFEAKFLESWRGILFTIDQFRRERGLPEIPVLFTELGYRTRRGSSLDPWAGDGFGVVGGDDAELVLWRDLPEDLEERAIAVRALRIASAERPGLLAGILYWKLSTLEEHLAIEPFVAILGSDDPMLPELRAFRAQN